jgi:hypothetical protein
MVLKVHNHPIGVFATEPFLKSASTLEAKADEVRDAAMAEMVCLLSAAVVTQPETDTISGTVTGSTGAVISVLLSRLVPES